MSISITKFNPFLKQGNDLKLIVQEMEIKTFHDIEVANERKKQIQKILNEIEQIRVIEKKPFLDQAGQIDLLAKECKMPTEEAKTILTRKVLTYQEEQDRIRREEEGKINKVVLEIENAKTLEALAEMKIDEKYVKEQKIINALESKKIEIERMIDAEEEVKKRREEKEMLAEIRKEQDEEKKKLENQKIEQTRKEREIEQEKKSIAQEKLELEGKVAFLKEQKEKEKKEKEIMVKGIKRYWKVSISDENLVPREYCSPDTKKINAAVKAGVKEIPGVKIFEDKKFT